MSDAHEHGHSCGHAHLPNPYVSAERSAQLRDVVVQLHRLSVVTTRVDTTHTASHAGLVAIAANAGGIIGVTIRALMWELADILNVLANGREFQTEPEGGRDQLDATGAPEEKFGFYALDAFFLAAGAGDIHAALRVVDAMEAEAPNLLKGEEDTNPDRVLVQLFANALTSSAFSLSQTMHDPLAVFAV